MTGSNRVRAAVRWDEIAEVRMRWVFDMSNEDPADTEQWHVGIGWRIITRANRSIRIATRHARANAKQANEMGQLGFAVREAFQRLHPHYTTRRKHATWIYAA